MQINESPVNENKNNFKIEQNFKQQKLQTLEESILLSLVRDIRQILRRVRMVIIPFGETKKLKNWDLWGPLVLCISLSWTLSKGTFGQAANDIFGIVFCLVWIGSVVISLNAQLFGGNLSIFHCICTLGYSLFPMNIIAFSCITFQSYLKLPIQISLVSFAYIWSCKSASIYMSSLVPEQVKLLALYPVYLYFIFIAFFIAQIACN